MANTILYLLRVIDDVTSNISTRNQKKIEFRKHLYYLHVS
jgi:hypothetical protein